MLNLTVVGAGDVVRNRYLDATSALPADRLVRIGDVLDTGSELEYTGTSKLLSVDQRPKFHRMPNDSVDQLVAQMATLGLLKRPVVISTPSQYHTPYATALLRAGATVIVEKPYAVDLKQVGLMHEVVRHVGLDRLFLFGYYALEKGLALLTLARRGVGPAYRALLSPHADEDQWRDLRSELGRPRCIRAALLEGTGPAARLDHRQWILDPSVGGNTVETFYHLVCCLLPLLDSTRDLNIRHAYVSAHRQTATLYARTTGSLAAETLTVASLRFSADGEAWLVCGKYAPPQMHQRWMKIEFQRGYVAANFDSGGLAVETPSRSVDFDLRFAAPYVTQFLLLVDKTRSPKNTPTEYKLFRDALLLTLDIRERSSGDRCAMYETDDLDDKWLVSALGFPGGRSYQQNGATLRNTSRFASLEPS